MVKPGAVPDVPPAPPGTHRPRWSVMIPTYNCADFLAATLASVLVQDLGADRMHIEVVDDCSPADRPEDVVAEIGRDRVGFWRQPANVGIARNFTSCVTRSKGELVHVLHGDDIVYPGFYQAVEDLLADYPGAGGAVVACHDLDEAGTVLSTAAVLRSDRGLLDGRHETFFEWNPLRAPSIVVRRSVYEQVGGYRDGLRYCADWDQWKRIVAATTLAYEPAVLAGYRIHGRSDTAKLATSVAQLREMIDSVTMAHDYLPGGQTRAWTAMFYHRTRRWSWAALHDPRRHLNARQRADYALIALESIARQQLDRLAALGLRRGWHWPR